MHALFAHWEAFKDHANQNREEIDFVLNQIEENNKRWIEIKGKMNNKMFKNQDQLKDVNNCQRKIIETQKNHSEVLNKAVSLTRNNSRKLTACNQLFYARDQMLQVQTNVIGSLSALLNEIKSYRTAVFSYKLTISNSVLTIVNILKPMVLLPRTALEEFWKQW